MNTQANASFDHLSLQGGWSPGTWSHCEVGASELGVGDGCAPASSTGPPGSPPPGSEFESGGTFTVSGTGDISPYEPIPDIVGGVFKGSLAGLVALIALGAVFIGSEYRRGVIPTTFAGQPRGGRVIVAQALGLGGAAFPAGPEAIRRTPQAASARRRRVRPARAAGLAAAPGRRICASAAPGPSAAGKSCCAGAGSGL